MFHHEIFWIVDLTTVVAIGALIGAIDFLCQ